MNFKGPIKLPPGAKVLTTVLPPLVVAGPRRPAYEVVIPGWRPPSLNKLMRGRVRERIRLGKHCRAVVADACVAAGVAPALARRRVSLVVALGPGEREFDRDAPYKCLFDALKHAGAIKDDTCRWVDIGPLTFRRAPAGSTTIILEDMER